MTKGRLWAPWRRSRTFPKWRGAIGVEHLPHQVAFPQRTASVPSPVEKAALIDALRQANGNQSQAARILGVNRVTVWNRMKKHGVDVKKVMWTAQGAAYSAEVASATKAGRRTGHGGWHGQVNLSVAPGVRTSEPRSPEGALYEICVSRFHSCNGPQATSGSS